jgi:excisionase family DNA binding protein
MIESPAPEPDSLVSLAHASKVLGVTPMTLRRWINAGTFPAHRIGKLYKVRSSDLSQYLEASKVRGIGEDRSPV